MTTLLQDLRYAFRMLLKFPAFTRYCYCYPRPRHWREHRAFFGRQWRAPQPAALSTLHPARRPVRKERGDGSGAHQLPQFSRLAARHARRFSSLAIYRHEDYNLTGRGQPERVNGLMVSASFFPTLGIHPSLGRDFRSEDDRIGAAPVVMLSDGFWHSHFGASPNIVGNSIDLNGTDYTVTGILPPEFDFLRHPARYLYPHRPVERPFFSRSPRRPELPCVRTAQTRRNPGPGPRRHGLHCAPSRPRLSRS